MIIIDALIFILIVAAIHYYKLKNPDFLFFCKNAILFLPPDQEKVLQYEENKKKQKEQRKLSNKNQKGNKNYNSKQNPKQQDNNNNSQVHHQIPIIQLHYNQIKDYPFSTQYERILMTLVGLIIFYFFRALFNMVLPEISYLPFYILVVILVYTIKVSVDVFMVSAYRSMLAVSGALIINILFFIFLILFGNIEGVYDNNINRITQDYTKHLEIIVGENNSIHFINKYTVLFFILFINFFITLATIPTVVKFGNWYCKTLKQVYYQDEEQQKKNYKKMLNKSEESVQQTQKKLKQNSKITISLLNYYLIATLAFIILSHRFFLELGILQLILDILRLIFFSMSVSIILWTVKDSIQFNGTFAYQHVLDYFQQKDPEKRLLIRKKIVPYIYHLWYHLHQFMLRIMVPIVLVLLVIHWKYFVEEIEANVGSREIKPHSTNNNNDFNMNLGDYNYDTECSLNTDQLSIIKNLYKCPIKNYNQMNLQHKITETTIPSGVIFSENSIQKPAQMQEKFIKYGILNKDFLTQISEILLWYQGVTMYLTTVIYMLFLRKTVYEI